MNAPLAAVVGVLPPAWADRTLLVVLLVLVGAGATAVVLCRNPVRQVVVLSVYGLVLALLFLALQAPDVALSMLSVGAVVLPLLILLSLARIRQQDHRRSRAQSDQDGQR